MGRIRAAIEDDAKNPKRILTVRGVGYVFARRRLLVLRPLRAGWRSGDPQDPPAAGAGHRRCRPICSAPGCRRSSCWA
jgi:hypothetical protein